MAAQPGGVPGAQGDEVNLAARLMTEAAPGTVLVSGRIQKAVGSEFDLEPLLPIRLKGRAEPLLPFIVQGLRRKRAFNNCRKRIIRCQ